MGIFSTAVSNTHDFHKNILHKIYFHPEASAAKRHAWKAFAVVASPATTLISSVVFFMVLHHLRKEAAANQGDNFTESYQQRVALKTRGVKNVQILTEEEAAALGDRSMVPFTDPLLPLEKEYLASAHKKLAALDRAFKFQTSHASGENMDVHTARAARELEKDKYLAALDIYQHCPFLDQTQITNLTNLTNQRFEEKKPPFHPITAMLTQRLFPGKLLDEALMYGPEVKRHAPESQIEFCKTLWNKSALTMKNIGRLSKAQADFIAIANAKCRSDVITAARLNPKQQEDLIFFRWDDENILLDPMSRSKQQTPVPRHLIANAAAGEVSSAHAALDMCPEELLNASEKQHIRDRIEDDLAKYGFMQTSIGTLLNQVFVAKNDVQHDTAQ